MPVPLLVDEDLEPAPFVDEDLESVPFELLLAGLPIRGMVKVDPLSGPAAGGAGSGGALLSPAGLGVA